MEPVYEGPPLYRHWGLPEDSSVLARPAPDKKKMSSLITGTSWKETVGLVACATTSAEQKCMRRWAKSADGDGAPFEESEPRGK